MRACGTTQWGLARPAILLASAGTLLMLSLSVYFLPASKNAFKDLQFQIRNQFTSGLLQEGAFNTLSDRSPSISVRARPRLARRAPHPGQRRSGEDLHLHRAERAHHPGRRQAQRADDQRHQAGLGQHQEAALDADLRPLQPRSRPVPRCAGRPRCLQPDERYLGDLFNPTDADDNPTLRQRSSSRAITASSGPLYLPQLRGGGARQPVDRRAQPPRPGEAAAVGDLHRGGAAGGRPSASSISPTAA